MKPLVIVNPAAGQSRHWGDVATVANAFDSLQGKIHATDGPGDAEAAAYDALTSGDFDIVVAAGGDGTVNEVVNGALHAVDDGAELTGLGLVPLGTQNVLASELGIADAEPEAVAALIQSGKTTRIDAGKVGARYFTLMAGLGFDAAVVRGVEPIVKDILGPAAYAFATLGTLASYNSTHMTVTIDDETIRTDAFFVVVANAASYAYREIKIAPFATVNDGWLDICIFERPPTDRIGFFTQIMLLLARRHLKDPRVRYFRGKHVHIESIPRIQCQLDGEMGDFTPIDITLAPLALPVFVP